MKKILAIVLGCAMVLSLAACGSKQEVKPVETNPVETTPVEVIDPVETTEETFVGGWTKGEAYVISDAENEIFVKALENFDGPNYSPLATVATQVVSGTNYCFLVKYVETDDVEEKAEETLEETAELTEIAAESVEEVVETSENVENTEVADVIEATKNTEVAETTENTEVAETTEETVEATENTEAEEVVAKSKFALVFVYVDLEGNANIVNVVELDIESADDFDIDGTDFGALYAPVEEESVEENVEEGADEVVEDSTENTVEGTVEETSEESIEDTSDTTTEEKQE